MESLTKKELRSRARELARRSDPSLNRELSVRIMDRIERMPQFCAARTVALYNALPDEVATDVSIRKWSAAGKRVVLPVVTGGGEMHFREYHPLGNMRQGAFGIGEPSEGDEVSAGEIDFVVVPGMAFSRTCQRLGRGKGYYDRFLASTRAYKVGVCYGVRMVDAMTCEPHDVAMDAVATEDGVMSHTDAMMP